MCFPEDNDNIMATQGCDGEINDYDDHCDGEDDGDGIWEFTTKYEQGCTNMSLSVAKVLAFVECSKPANYWGFTGRFLIHGDLHAECNIMVALLQGH